MKRTALLGAVALLALIAPATAAAGPIFNLDMHHAQTNFPPGGAPVEIFKPPTQQGSAQASEIQQYAFTATGGAYKLRFGADTTVDLPYNATTAQVRAALVALPSIGAANVDVSGGMNPDDPGEPRGGTNQFRFSVRFTGSLALTDVPELVVSDGAAPLRLNPQYWFDLDNVGDAATAGPITLTVKLPSGISRYSVRTASEGLHVDWSCPGSPGDTTVTCTTSESISRHKGELGLALIVDVRANICGASPTCDKTAVATVTGGGAPPAPPAVGCAVGIAACARETAHISPEEAGFGILPETFVPDFFETDGLTPERQAGAHPDLLTVPFDFTTVEDQDPFTQPFRKAESDSIRNLNVDLPPGFIGNPTAVGECPAADFILQDCPLSSVIGFLYVRTPPFFNLGGTYSNVRQSVFNMSHPRGSVSDLAFVFFSNPVHIRASLDPANRYAITTRVPDINESLPPLDQKLTVWGVPADPSHDAQRCSPAATRDCPTDIEVKPFLTVPSQCEADNAFRLHHYDSWQDPGEYGPDLTYTMPGKMTGCEKPRFDPSVQLNPTGRQANTPTGLDVSIQLPQNENPDALATPPVKSTVVRFPPGMTVNPAFADGLDGCTLAQIGLGTNNPVACPDNSRIGEVFLTTPLLPRALEGSMYLAKQDQNPFGSTFAMYMAVHDTEERGVLLKIPGRIDLDQSTGQITTTFDDLPQFPFDDFTLSFRSGQRAPLVNPPSCGTQRIEVQITSYAQPNEVLDASNTYEVNEGPNGTPCPASSNSRPFDPKMNAGTLNPTAGAHSPFVFRLTRSDTEQDISRVTTVLPPGLSAKLAGVSQCPDSAISQISTAEGTGQAEFDSPHCPANSLVGQLNAGVGAGTNPNYFGGKVYLAGPYRDAPLSFITVVPAIAGPYDFGSVVVRIAAYLDPKTAQAKAISDPFPPIVHGVLLHIRDIRLNLNRDQFTLNPTNCSPMSVDGSILSDLGALASPSSRFQVGECASLGFKPKLLMRLKGGTKRGAHPQLTATLIPRAGDANIAALSVAFPRSEFLENAHIRTVCTRADFAASNCPAGAIYGRATAYTPILDDPLQANVYLRSSSNLLPDVVPDFRGPPTLPLRIESAGRVDSINGGIRNTFDLIPDAPVSRVIFSLQGGKKGLLVNSRDICARTYRAKVIYTAHNGARHVQRPKMVASCGRARRGKRGKKRRGHGGNTRLLHQRAVTSQR
ncbi:MAG TPA: hypothetical protein VNM89_02965 [Solirubrobacterales bacterium]|nr:hypothetical protein [Solirubrobacterales bacterium]